MYSLGGQRLSSSRRAGDAPRAGAAALVAIGCTLVAIAGAHAEVIFDAGAPDPVRVECATDAGSSESYAPQAFGAYPAGTWMAASLERGACAAWPNLPGVCAGVFVANLRPAADCGCNFSGVLERPTELVLRWDPADLAARGVDPASLRLWAFGIEGPRWTPVPGARFDVPAHTVYAQATGFVMGYRWYGLAADPATSPLAPVSWSAARALWR